MLLGAGWSKRPGHGEEDGFLPLGELGDGDGLKLPLGIEVGKGGVRKLVPDGDGGRDGGRCGGGGGDGGEAPAGGVKAEGGGPARGDGAEADEGGGGGGEDCGGHLNLEEGGAFTVSSAEDILKAL